MSAQLQTILADLERHKHAFDFDQHGLGETVMEAAAEGISEAMDAAIDPNGQPWAPLSESYDKWKSKYYPGLPMARLEGIMWTREQLIGLSRITTHGMTQVYGTTQEARDHAEWFQEGNANQPERRFYSFNGTAEYFIERILDQAFDSATS